MILLLAWLVLSRYNARNLYSRKGQAQVQMVVIRDRKAYNTPTCIMARLATTQHVLGPSDNKVKI